jgi:pimeloyl-ACP methyl ester carboxylesterase
MQGQNYNEKEILIKGRYDLKGTMIIPKKADQEKYPVVIIVAGSGEIDRNGTIAKAKLDLGLYKDLAHLISSLGFITLRYDKRGVGESKGSYLDTGMWDLVEDIEAIIEHVKSEKMVDSSKIILLGHSEGCTLITAVNSRTPVAGLVYLAGAAESLEEALTRQRSLAYDELRMSKGIKGFLFRFINIEKIGEKNAQKLYKKMLESKTDTIKYQFQTINAKWFREHLRYNVYEDLKKVICPVIAVTGDKDFQTNPERLQYLKDYVKGPNESYVIENMDHGLKEVIGDTSILTFKKQYIEGSTKPLHPQLVERLTYWFQLYFLRL